MYTDSKSTISVLEWGNGRVKVCTGADDVWQYRKTFLTTTRMWAKGTSVNDVLWTGHKCYLCILTSCWPSRASRTHGTSCPPPAASFRLATANNINRICYLTFIFTKCLCLNIGLSTQTAKVKNHGKFIQMSRNLWSIIMCGLDATRLGNVCYQITTFTGYVFTKNRVIFWFRIPRFV